MHSLNQNKTLQSVRLIRKLALISSFALLLTGCVKDEDFNYDRIAATNWDPDFAIPLINSSLSINDLTGFSNSTIVDTDSNGFVYLIYRSNIFSVYGFEFMPLLNQSYLSQFTPLVADSTDLYQSGTFSRTISTVIPFNVSGSEEIDSIFLRTGILSTTLTSDLPHSGSVRIDIPDATLNGIPYSRTIPLDHNLGIPLQVNASDGLGGYRLNLTGAGSFNQLRVNYTITFSNSASLLSLTDKNLYISSELNNLQMEYAFGNFGQRPLSLPGDSSRIELFNNTVFGNIAFDDPYINFEISNSFGIPVNAQLTALYAIFSNGSTAPVTGSIPNPLPVQTPVTPGQTAITSFYLDKTNSNISVIMDQNPRYIAFDVNAVSNSPVPTYNFISDSSQFRVDAEVKLPLKGSANGFTVVDTTDFELENIEEVQKAIFRINAQNGFPADAYVQIYFTDTNYLVIDSLLSDASDFIVESGLLDLNGKVILPNKKMRDEEFDKARLERIYDAKKLIITAIVSTQNAPVQQVPIYSSYTLDIRIGVRAFLNIEF